MSVMMKVAKRIEKQLAFFLDEFGEKVVKDGIEKKALIRDVVDTLSDYDDKMIRCLFEIKTGDLLEYQNQPWLVISEVDRDRKSYRARIRKVNHHIHFVLDGDVHTFPTIIEGTYARLQIDRYMTLQDGKILVTIPADISTQALEIEHRFIKMGRAWKVTGVDRTRKGLVLLHCELTLFSSRDDKENEIADAHQIVHRAITLSSQFEQVAIGQTMAIEAIVTGNGEVISEELRWESSDETIATVENGNVTGLQEGKVSITASLVKRPFISTGIEIEVVQSMPDVTTYKMWSSNVNGSSKSYMDFSIYSHSEKIFGVEKYINGSLTTPNDTYTFMLNPNGAPSKSYTYTVVNNRTVKIQAHAIFDEGMILTATSNETGESVMGTIRFVGLW